MSNFLVFISLSLVSVAALYYFFFMVGSNTLERYVQMGKPGEVQDDHREEPQVQEEEVKEDRRPAGNRAAQRMRNRRRNNAVDDSDEDGAAAPAGEEILNDPDVKLSKKEILKLQKKQEKERMREGMRQQREAQEQRRQEIEAKQEEAEQARRDEEAKEAEEARIRKEAEENREREEYNKWKEMFAVEEVGDKQEADKEFENKLQHFIDYIQLRKVVLFEDLAAEFGLTTKDVVDRIQRLQESGRLVGITDDRGKFIYMTEQECEAVARYIKSRGRVNKGDLLMECNKLVRMQPKEADKARIKLEQKSLLEKVEKEFAQDEPKA